MATAAECTLTALLRIGLSVGPERRNVDDFESSPTRGFAKPRRQIDAGPRASVPDNHCDRTVAALSSEPFYLAKNGLADGSSTRHRQGSRRGLRRLQPLEAAAVVSSNTGPHSPGLSVTDVCRNSSGANGKTTRLRKRRSAADERARRSAPQAAEVTSAMALWRTSVSSMRRRVSRTADDGNRGTVASHGSMRRPAAATIAPRFTPQRYNEPGTQIMTRQCTVIAVAIGSAVKSHCETSRCSLRNLHPCTESLSGTVTGRHSPRLRSGAVDLEVGVTRRQFRSLLEPNTP